mgnify:CR=1 FL=1
MHSSSSNNNSSNDNSNTNNNNTSDDISNNIGNSVYTEDIEKDAEESSKPKQLFRSKHAIYELLAQFHYRCKNMTQSDKIEIQSSRTLCNKRKRDTEHNTHYAFKEMQENALRPDERLTSYTLGNITERFCEAYQQNKLTIHDTLDDQYMSIIHSKHWKAVD